MDTYGESAFKTQLTPYCKRCTWTPICAKNIKAGDIMSGRLDMGGNRITDVYDPTSNQDAWQKYVDVLSSDIDAPIISADNKTLLRVVKVGNVMNDTLSMGKIK